MENKQTAVEWLFEKININLSAPMSVKFKEMFEQAKEMEKEEIIDAYDKGEWNDGMNGNAEQYYNQTYGGKEL